MYIFESYVESMNDAHRSRIIEILNWVQSTYPQLQPVFKWKQPMFTDHGTFIIGFSVAKNHVSVAPEGYIDDVLSKHIQAYGYDHTKKLFHIPFDQPVHFELLAKVIDRNIEEKKDCTTFWRQQPS